MKKEKKKEENKDDAILFKEDFFEFLRIYSIPIALFVLSQFGFYILEKCKINHLLAWKIVALIIVVAICFLYYYKKKKTVSAIKQPPYVKNYKEMMKYIEKNKLNETHNNPKEFSDALNFISERIYKALANFTDKAVGYDTYGINILLLSGDDTSQKPEETCLQLISSKGNTKLINNYEVLFNGNHKKSPESFKLSENTPYYQSYQNYQNNELSELIITTTNINDKLKSDSFKSALKGTWDFPYDSSIVVPILPLENGNKAKIEGFFNVISDNSKPFDEGKLSEEAESFLEILSGSLYEVCHNYEVK